MTKPKKTPKREAMPSPPRPPSTRAEIESMFLDYLTNEVERTRAGLDEWRAKFAAQTSAELIVNDLAWAQSVFEAASMLMVYERALNALKGQNNATMDSLREYAVDQAIHLARYPRRSSSPMDNLTHQNTTQAWACLARDLLAWTGSLKRADEHYGTAPKPAQAED